MYEVKRLCRHTVDQHQRQLTGFGDVSVVAVVVFVIANTEIKQIERKSKAPEQWNIQTYKLQTHKISEHLG